MTSETDPILQLTVFFTQFAEDGEDLRAQVLWYLQHGCARYVGGKQPLGVLLVKTEEWPLGIFTSKAETEKIYQRERYETHLRSEPPAQIWGLTHHTRSSCGPVKPPCLFLRTPSSSSSRLHSCSRRPGAVRSPSSLQLRMWDRVLGLSHSSSRVVRTMLCTHLGLDWQRERERHPE